MRRPQLRRPAVRRPLSLAAAVLLVAGVTLTSLATVQLRRDAARTASQRLAEHARQTTNLFSTVAQSVGAVLMTGGVVADSTDGGKFVLRLLRLTTAPAPAPAAKPAAKTAAKPAATTPATTVGG